MDVGAPLEQAGVVTSDEWASAAAGREWTWSVPVAAMQVAGLTSIGAGAIHAAVSGVHSDFVTLTRLFVLGAMAQLAAGLWALVRGGRLATAAVIVVNAVAVAAWAVTRFAGVSAIDGLESAEPAQFADTACAALGAISVVVAGAAFVRGRTHVARVRLGVPALAVGGLTVASMLVGVGGHGAGGAHAHGAGDVEVTATDDGHSHDDAEALAVDVGADSTTRTAWPRPWDPALGIDFTDAGATRAQELRAAGLLNATQRDLPQFADPAVAYSLGYRSIGDSGTGYEHYINLGLINDDVWLDPTQPESLVYLVEGDQRTLVSAMFIASERPLDAPELVEFGGPLMQWHAHGDLCWEVGDGGPRFAGIAENGVCPEPTVLAGGDLPMVHVWITPNPCGPFAALEGHGAGQTATGVRTDQCVDDHGAGTADGHAHDAGAAASVTDAVAESGDLAFDPARPINLSGTAGVTEQQQAFAENLIADTVRNLPQWSDPAVAEAAGFHSIGDGATGHEHFIQWDWINDDVFLDPDAPESLVYEPQPDGSRKLVSAMYMLPDSYSLGDVPDWGGELMQWHIHDNLCFTDDPESPRVGGLTDADGGCTAPLVRKAQSPMIHVWIIPQQCGPFASLDGVGAGQVAVGEERLCDELHGSH